MQHQVILSLGSNQGEKAAIIVQCIQYIHQQLGTVVRVSKLYESSSWGFESDNFFNCALLVHTQKSPQQLLSGILQIEKELGRIREEASGYQARNIDIDIISFNNEVVEEENLSVPHPQLQNRLFVLLPVNDLSVDFVHPVSHKTIPQLIQECKDQGNCKVISAIVPPLAGLVLEKYNYIAIEGNIGAGKTTLACRIAEDFNAKTILERFADNPFLPKFYKDQNRYAFLLEMSFLADRYQQLSDDLAQFDLFKDFLIADYHIFKSLIFAKVTLAEDEYRLYKTLFDIIYKEMQKPDLYVYLYQDTQRLLQNIKRRGRSYEQEISAEYLDKINKGYLDYIKSQTDLNVLIINVSDRDFVEKQEDYIFILETIEKKILAS
ncbi:MAG TPA: 2-amino-4-hydroxy-6-hydroxymethyldihydropteridine diphosphokinase [Flavobacterium sp.]